MQKKKQLKLSKEEIDQRVEGAGLNQVSFKYKVSRCHTLGESQDHTSEEAHKGSTLALKPIWGRSHQKSKTGVSVAPWKEVMSSKI